ARPRDSRRRRPDPAPSSAQQAVARSIPPDRRWGRAPRLWGQSDWARKTEHRARAPAQARDIPQTAAPTAFRTRNRELPERRARPDEAASCRDRTRLEYRHRDRANRRLSLPHARTRAEAGRRIDRASG